MINRHRSIPFLVTLFFAASMVLVDAGCSSSGAPPTPAPEAAKAEAPSGRLPQGVTPQAYRIALEVDPRQPHFGGHVEIDITLDVERDHIWLHGQNLQVSSAQVIDSTGAVHAAQYEQLTRDGTSRVSFTEPVAPGKATLVFAYRAPFDEQLQGLYRVREGERWYAFTQFEAISARLCFPGFDEPAFKTPFQLTLSVPNEQVAIANTPTVATRSAKDGWHTFEFAPTKPLPTYLVAMAVGEFDVVETQGIATNAVRKNVVPLRGVAVKGKGPQMAYALEHTGALLSILEEYTGIPYPFEKIDIVAVPDFASGAMENVGVITFREWLLLLNERSPAQQQNAFAYVMAHELAHQWFGNLVTMPWWDDIWLNEAFATWLGYRAVHTWRPEIKANFDQVEKTLSAIGNDSLVASRQIRQPIHSNHDISNAFDAITYSKGGGVLSMFERYLGEEKFRQGISHYLAKHRYGSADYHDFLTGLSEGSGTDITSAFTSFLTQPGIPLLQVEPSCVGAQGKLEVRQSRYFPVGSKGDPKQTWQVPMCVKSGVGEAVHEQCTLITEPEQTVELTHGCPDWIMPNAESAGYYRWEIPLEAWKALQERGLKRLSAKDMMAVADAIHAGFAKASIPTARALDLAADLVTHSERAVAVRPMSLLHFARERLVAPSRRAVVERYAQTHYGKLQKELGLHPQGDETMDRRLLRRDVLSFMAEVGRDQALRRELTAAAHRYLGYPDGKPDDAALDSNLIEVALGVAGEEGDEPFIRFVAEALDGETDPSKRRYLLRALASATQANTVENVRKLVLTNVLRANELTALLNGHMAKPENRDGGWKWLVENFEPLVKRLPPNAAGALPWVGTAFCSAEQSSTVKEFFEPRVSDLRGGPRNLAGSLEAIDLCAAKVEAQRASAEEFFTKLERAL